MRMLLGLDTPTAVDIPCPRVRPRPRRDLEPGDALEWRKCWSVKSNVFGVLAAIMVGIGLGWIFSSVAGTGDARGPSSGSPLEVRLAGFNLGQIILGVFGVPTVTTEYSSGLIRSTFTAVGRRIPVLCAKVVTYGLVSLAAMTVAVLAAFLGGQALYARSAKSLSLFDAGVLRSVLGQVLCLTGIGIIGVALGFIVRSAAAAIGILFSSLLLAPALVGLLPSGISDVPCRSGDSGPDQRVRVASEV